MTPDVDEVVAFSLSLSLKGPLNGSAEGILPSRRYRCSWTEQKRARRIRYEKDPEKGAKVCTRVGRRECMYAHKGDEKSSGSLFAGKLTAAPVSSIQNP